MTTQSPTQEGEILLKIPSISKPCHTYYKGFGDLKSGLPPLVCLHGGPGGGHVSLLGYAELWPRYGIPVLLYDHIGCGKSTHLPEKAGDKDFWSNSLFSYKLENLLDYLELRDGTGYHFLGQSFGGMIAPDFATSQPRGLQRLIIASGSASTELASQAFDELKNQMPTEHQKVVDEAVCNEEYESEAYKKAFDYVIKMFMCHTPSGPLPEEMAQALRNLDTDATVKNAVLGSSPFSIDGSLKGWSCIPRLHHITAPTLLQTGEFDTNGRDCSQQPFFDLIPRVRWVRLDGAGHNAHLESPELKQKVLKLFGEFLHPSTKLRA
ncbi:proline-specific peptidase [Myriangium duriaei CBS 260.36]|uniref:Proline-specific peptidase n=1 Tax=Myriangium duriaei CBS 260.36 TaxID=1168546 RepID=A0A9P4J6Y1_9PEZI|nr:proline-specific peptidase [Myriangium duriaei CBS 260.36]